MAIDKKLKYNDQRLTKAQQKKTKPANQGGGPNYLGKEKTVTVPKKWLSSPDHVVAELAYITPREQKILLDADLYGSLKGKPNKGPEGVMSLQGDMGSIGGGSSTGGSGNNVGPAELGLTTRGPTGPTGPTGPGELGLTTRGPTTTTTTTDDGGFLSKVKDYVLGGGIIGMGVRGLNSLFGGPTTKDTTAPDQRNMFNVSGPVTGPPAQREGGGEGIMAMYNPNMLNVAGEVVDEVPVSQEEEDFIQRYRVANEFRQDKQGQLDPAILEMISKLYT